MKSSDEEDDTAWTECIALRTALIDAGADAVSLERILCSRYRTATLSPSPMAFSSEILSVRSRLGKRCQLTTSESTRLGIENKVGPANIKKIYTGCRFSEVP